MPPTLNTRIKLRKCIFKKCTSTNENSDLKFFGIPNSKILADKWLDECNKPNLKHLSTITLYQCYHVCSLHFDRTDYTNIFTPHNKTLKRGIIPKDITAPNFSSKCLPKKFQSDKEIYSANDPIEECNLETNLVEEKSLNELQSSKEPLVKKRKPFFEILSDRVDDQVTRDLYDKNKPLRESKVSDAQPELICTKKKSNKLKYKYKRKIRKFQRQHLDDIINYMSPFLGKVMTALVKQKIRVQKKPKARLINMILAILGLLISLATIYVEIKKKANKDYIAFCDVDSSISCSNIFASKYGKGFGVLGAVLGNDSSLVQPNGVYGVLFYFVILILGEITAVWAAFIHRNLALVSNLMSIYLGYVLYFVLQSMCLLCVSCYVINILITVCGFIRVSKMSSRKQASKKQK